MATSDNLEPDIYQFLETIALHGGTAPDPTTGAMLTPIYQTTTYRQPAVGEHKGYTYSRSGNPTVTALEGRLAAIEGAEFATAYVTGLAATTVLCLALLKAGDRVVLSQARSEEQRLNSSHSQISYAVFCLKKKKKKKD